MTTQIDPFRQLKFAFGIYLCVTKSAGRVMTMSTPAKVKAPRSPGLSSGERVSLRLRFPAPDPLNPKFALTDKIHQMFNLPNTFISSYQGPVFAHRSFFFSALHLPFLISCKITPKEKRSGISLMLLLK